MQEATKQYGSMWNKVQNGEITEQHWMDFCATVLDEMLEECAEILIRLKYR
jgi:hypothetical protein